LRFSSRRAPARRRPSASMALASSVTCRRRHGQRLAAAGPGGTSAASAPPTWPCGHVAAHAPPSCSRLSVSATGSASRPPTSSRRRRRSGGRPTRRAAGSARRRAPAPSRGRGAAFAQRLQAVRPRSARAWRRRSGPPRRGHAGEAGRQLELRIVAAPAPPAWPEARHGASAAACAPPRQPGQVGVLLGQRGPARSPTPAQGTSAKQRGRWRQCGCAPWSCGGPDSRITGHPPSPLRGVLLFCTTPCNCPPAPASASPCPAPPARPTPCCWPAWPPRPRPAAACWPSSRRAGRQPSGWPTNCPSSTRPARGAVPRLGNAALRHLQPAPGPGQRTPGHAVARAQCRCRRGAAARHHRADAAGAAVVHGRHHLPLQAEDAAGRSR
jgi:hypothetical protein